MQNFFICFFYIIIDIHLCATFQLFYVINKLFVNNYCGSHKFYVSWLFIQFRMMTDAHQEMDKKLEKDVLFSI